MSTKTSQTQNRNGSGGSDPHFAVGSGEAPAKTTIPFVQLI